MRDSVADPHYLAKLELGTLLTQWTPTHFMSRYRMVTFTTLPYAYAYERGRAQNEVMEQLLRDFQQPGDVPQDIATTALQQALPPLQPFETAQPVHAPELPRFAFFEA